MKKDLLSWWDLGFSFAQRSVIGRKFPSQFWHSYTLIMWPKTLYSTYLLSFNTFQYIYWSENEFNLIIILSPLSISNLSSYTELVIALDHTSFYQLPPFLKMFPFQYWSLKSSEEVNCRGEKFRSLNRKIPLTFSWLNLFMYVI